MSCNKDSNDYLFAVVFIVACIVGAIGIKWYNAGVQQQVWEREGCHLTHWEVFCNAHPIERVIK